MKTKEDFIILHNLIRESYTDDFGEMCGIEFELRKKGFPITAKLLHDSLDAQEEPLKTSLLISLQDEFNQG